MPPTIKEISKIIIRKNDEEKITSNKKKNKKNLEEKLETHTKEKKCNKRLDAFLPFLFTPSPASAASVATSTASPMSSSEFTVNPTAHIPIGHKVPIKDIKSRDKFVHVNFIAYKNNDEIRYGLAYVEKSSQSSLIARKYNRVC